MVFVNSKQRCRNAYYAGENGQDQFHGAPIVYTTKDETINYAGILSCSCKK
jgi:hypothetical protein